jgi:hypothetical protein
LLVGVPRVTPAALTGAVPVFVTIMSVITRCWPAATVKATTPAVDGVTVCVSSTVCATVAAVAGVLPGTAVPGTGGSAVWASEPVDGGTTGTTSMEVTWARDTPTR